MTSFDDEFADRVREVFDAYHEPVDPAALARMRAELAHGAAPSHGAAPAPDRPPVGRARVRRWRALAALAVLLAAAGTWGLAEWGRAEWATPDPSTVAAGPEAAPDPADGVAETGMADAIGANPQIAQEIAQARVERAPPTSPPALVVPEPGRSASRRSASAPGPVLAPADPSGRPADLAVRPTDSVPPDASASAPGSGTAEPVAALPAQAPTLPAALPGPSVFATARPHDGPLAEAPRERATPALSRVQIVVATTSTFADGGFAEGAGVSAGLAVERRVGRRISVSGGAAAIVRRAVFESQAATAVQGFNLAAQDVNQPVDVADQSTVTTVALEIPLDLALDLVRTRRGRLTAAVGLTSTLYLTQTFEDRGATYLVEETADPSGVTGQQFFSEPFAGRTVERPLSRLDLGRQLNLALGIAGTGRQPLALDVVVRLPLGGLTSRDLYLSTLGLRLRVGLP